MPPHRPPPLSHLRPLATTAPDTWRRAESREQNWEAGCEGEGVRGMWEARMWNMECGMWGVVWGRARYEKETHAAVMM